MSKYIDYDDICGHPETLEEVKPKFRPSPTPPPYIHPTGPSGAQSHIDDSAHGAKGPKRKKKHQPSQGDVVLLSYLAPNHLDVAREAGRVPLCSASHSEDSDSEDEKMSDVEGPTNSISYSAARSSEQRSNDLMSQARAAVAVTTAIQGESIKEESIPGNGGYRGSSHQRAGSGFRTDYDSKSNMSLCSKLPPGTPIEIDGEVRDTNIAADGLMQLGGGPGDVPMMSKESITTSPIIAQHLIQPSRTIDNQTLPRMDRVDSMSQPGSAVSPQADSQLPSVRQLLVEVDMNDAAPRSNNRHARVESSGPLGPAPTLSPSMKAKQAFSGPGSPTRYSRTSNPSPGTSNDDRSPINMFDGISPVSSNSPVNSRFASRRRATSDATSPRYPSLVHSETSGSRSNPNHSSDGQDSSSLPTPNDQRRSLDGQPLISLPHISSSSSSSHADGLPTGLYRCTFDGCTAAPFQTQYLLNSHANVHSETRPHYCPVKGCSRGEGGRGFKRKNEMIRHGLVHDSPGYVCPYCPDREHKYPRPDNLQRHVRMHHETAPRDDPILQDVLSQRPSSGANRGRRRPRGSMP